MISSPAHRASVALSSQELNNHAAGSERKHISNNAMTVGFRDAWGLPRLQGSTLIPRQRDRLRELTFGARQRTRRLGHGARLDSAATSVLLAGERIQQRVALPPE